MDLYHIDAKITTLNGENLNWMNRERGGRAAAAAADRGAVDDVGHGSRGGADLAVPARLEKRTQVEP